MTDWVAWHATYEDPASSLRRRLEVVRTRVAEALDAVGTPRPRLLSLCAGDGRDVLPALTPRPHVSAALVELDRTLAERARSLAPPNADVRCADASDVRTFADVLPVDVLLLCGVFGNVDHVDVLDLVLAVPHLLADDGYVVWTRGGGDPDPRRFVRTCFDVAGFDELAFDGEPEPYGVGLARLARRPSSVPDLPDPLFRFRR